jgi:hypothetical protein
MRWSGASPPPTRRPVDTPPRDRVDPFAFPTDTTFRFVLLVAAVLGASLYLYNAVYLSIGNRSEDLATYRACLEAAGPLQVQDADALGARSDFLHECTAPIERPKAAFMLGGVLVPWRARAADGG